MALQLDPLGIGTVPVGSALKVDKGSPSVQTLPQLTGRASPSTRRRIGTIVFGFGHGHDGT